MAPTMNQESVPVLIQAAERYWARVGDAATAPALRTVVVPGVTADNVQTPTPMFMTVMTVPMGWATLAFVGSLKVLAEALDIVTSV